MTGIAPLPPAGLCERCRHGERLASRRSQYLRCGRADIDPSFTRYPLLPVLACRGFDTPDPGPGEGRDG